MLGIVFANAGSLVSGLQSLAVAPCSGVEQLLLSGASHEEEMPSLLEESRLGWLEMKGSQDSGHATLPWHVRVELVGLQIWHEMLL